MISLARNSFSSRAKDRETRRQVDILRYRSACGCELGSVFMIASTTAFLMYVTLRPVNWSLTGSVFRGLVWVVSMSVFGKLVGLTYARVRLHMLRAEQAQESLFTTPLEGAGN